MTTQEPATSLGSDNLDAALNYTKMGLYVFPCFAPKRLGVCSCEDGEKSGDERCQNVGKHPMLDGGHLNATLNPRTIAYWWNKWPNANIGINCGMSNMV